MSNSQELFTRKTQSIIYNYQQKAVQRMLDFDYACRRETPSVVAIVNPTSSGYHKCFFGTREILIPMYTGIEEACRKHPSADVMINYASFRSAYATSLEALHQPSIKTLVIIAEGVPEQRSKELLAIADKAGKCIIGPATVGGIKPGAFKIGDTAGPIENIIDTRLYVPGFVGFVSKSGGMSNEMYNMLSLVCGQKNGAHHHFPALYEGIAIGGDRYPGSRIIDHLLRYEATPEVKLLVALGEVGGEGEYEIAEAVKAGKIKKPLVMWVMGTCTSLFPGEVQFGHAGARADGENETASAKNQALREAGVIVPNSFDDLGDAIHEVYLKLLADGTVENIPVPDPVVIPIDLAVAEKQGLVRRSSSFVSTISDDRGEELTYNGIPISDVIEQKLGVGGVIGLLWFKKKLPDVANRFLETVLKITADHGPAVAGAHNAIVAARAGKDLVSSIASGLLTIGPRFGGAIDGAAQFFKDSVDSGESPEDFVKSMKQKGINIPGIGHRVKSLQNPDKRVELLKDFAFKNFGNCEYLKYALEVEQITTKKKANLILNVDGCIAVCFMDMLESTGLFSEAEIREIIGRGALNGLFIIGRTIGLVGHVIDQQRLEQPLYRHPWEDITYMID